MIVSTIDYWVSPFGEFDVRDMPEVVRADLKASPLRKRGGLDMRYSVSKRAHEGAEAFARERFEQGYA